MNDDANLHCPLPADLPDDPLALARRWYDYAQSHAGQRNPNSMTLVTVGNGGQPAARIVLCKAFETDPGYLVFYTNYESRKGRELAANPRVAAVMHWDALGRQLRFEGRALRSPAEESDAYFASRGWGSRLGAWGSDQSRPVASRDALLAQVRTRAAELGIELGASTDTLAGDEPGPIPRPPHWGGYRLWIESLELWAEGAHRVHDRARYERAVTLHDEATAEVSPWTAVRLQP